MQFDAHYYAKISVALCDVLVQVRKVVTLYSSRALIVSIIVLLFRARVLVNSQLYVPGGAPWRRSLRFKALFVTAKVWVNVLLTTSCGAPLAPRHLISQRKDLAIGCKIKHLPLAPQLNFSKRKVRDTICDLQLQNYACVAGVTPKLI